MRLYKTRGLAVEACRAGWVEISGVTVKPARVVRVGEVVMSRHDEITRTTKVLGLIAQRVGAQVAKDFAEDLTPTSEYAKRQTARSDSVAFRPKGQGRPTKKERRVMEEFSEF